MKLFMKSLFISNILTLLVSIFYILFPGENIFWNSYGILLLLTLTSNILFSVKESRHRKLAIAYLLLSSIGIFIAMLLNTAASLAPANVASRSVVALILVLLLLIGGMVITQPPFLHTNKKMRGKVTSTEQSVKKPQTMVRKLLLFLLSFSLLIGILLAFIMVTNRNVGIVEVIISQYSVFYSFIFLSIAGLILKLSTGEWHSFKCYTVSVIGLSLFVLFNLPFFSIPILLIEAEESYSAAFGNEWKTYGGKESLFKDSPISIPAFFFGSPSKGYELEEDLLFYEGTEGVDRGLKLRFDVYTPSTDAQKLPGRGSTLIRIHGGGWDSGDKGAENFAQVNKYFASQGYIVYDVQYGLNNQDQFVDFLTVPEDKTGDFTIDDMVRHLGLFTHYLADNHDDYEANINSVFISGGSAGGHLANALALASSSGQYTDIIDNRITVNGIIPLYPANDLAQYRNIDGQDELVDPALLVNTDSPPALVYQGDKDSIVEPQVTKDFRESYRQNDNGNIAVIWMPYGAHGSDLYFSGFYSQSLIYYMERFLYQFR